MIIIFYKTTGLKYFVSYISRNLCHKITLSDKKIVG